MGPPRVGSDQRRVGFEYKENGVFVVPVERLHQLITNCGPGIGLSPGLAEDLLLLNNRHDVVVTAIPSDDERRGGGAVGPDAFARVGSPRCISRRTISGKRAYTA